MKSGLTNLLLKHQHFFGKVVDFNPSSEKLLAMDFTASNTELTAEVINDIDRFSSYVENQLTEAGAKFGIGGYDELRTVYDRSALFGDIKNVQEPRRLHLGVDIWGKAGTPIYAFMGGMVQSVAFNDNYGDYGATMIVLHQLDTKPFYVLYGHISLMDIEQFHAGAYVSRGQKIAHFGVPEENGHWPPHLHIQVIEELGIKEGDYPGVCKFSEREKYLANCPDPDLILGLRKFL
jgi:murein DD-endopeptidase MepM/ murein hydrolase activator NlpD